MKSILDQIDAFCKVAGILQAPKNMLKQITEWARSIYCGALLPVIDQEIAKLSKKKLFKPTDRIKELFFIRGMCMKYNRPDDTNPQSFFIKLDDTPYFSKLEQMDLEVSHKKVKREPVIQAEFVFNSERAKEIYNGVNWAGLWNGNLFVQKQLIPADKISRDSLLRVLNTISVTVEHELQHLIQEYLKRVKALNEWGGMSPQKTRDTKSVDQFGRKLNDPEKSVDHTLMDVEFYTNLNEVINSFIATVPKFPLRLHKLLFNVWIGRNSIEELEKATAQEFNKEKSMVGRFFGPKSLIDVAPYSLSNIRNARKFFESLQANQFEKYKKAVTELYKAVSQYL
jgi:hypothetical protein